MARVVLCCVGKHVFPESTAKKSKMNGAFVSPRVAQSLRPLIVNSSWLFLFLTFIRKFLRFAMFRDTENMIKT